MYYMKYEIGLLLVRYAFRNFLAGYAELEACWACTRQSLLDIHSGTAVIKKFTLDCLTVQASIVYLIQCTSLMQLWGQGQAEPSGSTAVETEQQ